MHHSTKPLVPWRQIFSWAILPVLILSLTLAAACGGDEPAAAPAPSGSEIQAAQETADQARAAAIAAQEAADQALALAEQARGTDAEAAAQAAADRAQATADQARATAEAAQAAAEAAQAAAEAAQAAAEEVARQGEDRPSITVIGGDSDTASVSGTGTGTGSVSGVGTGTGSASVSATGTGTATAMMTGPDGARGLYIPTGLAAETEGPTASDGYYTATTNREIYQKIPTDYQEIVKLTNQVNEGKPLPAAEIWLLYEAGSHTHMGNSSRTLRSFATGTAPSTYFPDSAEFYGSTSFLESPISNAIRGRNEAENYTDAQKRQAIQKGALRILYHWAKFYMLIGQDRSSSRLIDEAWAIYVGEEVNGVYPNSVAAVAQAREGNFGRQGTIDIPLRQAMDRARQAADDMDADALETATQEVFSRFNAIFYLSTVRYIGRVYDDAQAGDRDALGIHQVEALAFYQSIQPDVAKADPSADATIMAYLTGEPSAINVASRDGALAALNGVASDLLLTRSDLVTRYTDDIGDGPSGVPSPDTGDLDLSSSLFIPVGQEMETEGPTKSDGYYTPTTNREIYQKIPSDYQEIAKLTNVINDGKDLPTADILLLYEAGTHTRIGNQSRTFRSFARSPRRATDFPVATEFYGSSNFLDSPVSNAIRGRGSAEEYTDAQRRQAINKGILRILYHWTKFYMILGQERSSSRLIDEAWAIYIGEEVDGEYPNSLAALARSREGNFGREGAIDIPLRQAMDRARQAADDMDAEALETATNEVYSRLNAIFYLATVRYIGITQQDVADGKDHGTHQVEALAFYQSIQPEVAQASVAADETIVAYLEADASGITEESRDAALAALNGVASALLLNQSDLVTSY